MSNYAKTTIVAAFIGCVLAANYATSHFGMVHVAPGITATAGTYFAGAMFVLRNTLQDVASKRTVAAVIATGALLSFLIADPPIALASGVAVLFSEFADWAVYSPLRGKGYVRAALTANTVGTFLDTVLFLTVAGFPVWPSVPGQMIGKMTITAVVVTLVALARRARSGTSEVAA